MSPLVSMSELRYISNTKANRPRDPSTRTKDEVQIIKILSLTYKTIVTKSDCSDFYRAFELLGTGNLENTTNFPQNKLLKMLF